MDSEVIRPFEGFVNMRMGSAPSQAVTADGSVVVKIVSRMGRERPVEEPRS
jgi:hypothetical protein